MTTVSPSDLGAACAHRGTPAIERMVEHAPSTGGLALWVHHCDVPPTADRPEMPPVTTDGHTLFYARSFNRLTLARQAGCVAHGVLHVALQHTQRLADLRQAIGDVDPVLFNLCADAIVDTSLGHLAWLELAPDAVRLDRLLKTALALDVPADRALAEWDVERLYRAIDDRRPPPQRGHGSARASPGGQSASAGSGSSPGRAPQGSDTKGVAAASTPSARPDGPRSARARALCGKMALDLCPAGHGAGGPADRARDAAPEDGGGTAREWQERLQRAHAGDGEFSMLRGLIADLPRPRTPWEHVLRVRLAHALAPQPALSWSRPSRSYLANQGRAGTGRRMPFEPGRSDTRAVPRLVMVIDVSGSIDALLLERFAGEVEAAARRLGAGVVLVAGDDRVRAVTVFSPGRVDLGGVRCHGGGGTDFAPLLDEADRHRPDLVVVLTDLDGPVRSRPRWPVLWAVPPSHAAVTPPFGRKLVLG